MTDKEKIEKLKRKFEKIKKLEQKLYWLKCQFNWNKDDYDGKTLCIEVVCPACGVKSESWNKERFPTDPYNYISIEKGKITKIEKHTTESIKSLYFRKKDIYEEEKRKLVSEITKLFSNEEQDYVTTVSSTLINRSFHIGDGYTYS